MRTVSKKGLISGGKSKGFPILSYNKLEFFFFFECDNTGKSP